MVLIFTLLLVGAFLLLAEVVLPGMIAGVLGVLCLAAGVSLGYQNFGSETGNWLLLGTISALAFGVVLWFKYFPTSRLARTYTSHGTVGEIGTERPELVGQSGVAQTALRPSGVAQIGHERVDVVTEGALIERGTAVQVIGVEGARVIVRSI